MDFQNNTALTLPDQPDAALNLSPTHEAIIELAKMQAQYRPYDLFSMTQYP